MYTYKKCFAPCRRPRMPPAPKLEESMIGRFEDLMDC